MSFNPDSLFEATNVLIKKQLESVSFDLTIEATITDAKRAKDGIYTVSTGNSSFLAYSVEIGYKEDDIVMVTIPQGDYDKQKMIIGKKVDKTNSPLIYKSPFQQLINVSNNLIPVENQKTISLLANGKQFNEEEDFFGWEEELVNFTDSKAYHSGDKTIAISEDETIPTPALIWASGDLANTQSRYTRIGLKAQFQTWLSEYNTIQGNYGLALILGFTNADSSGGFLQSCIFDCSDFFGDPYNFETFYTQEILFDISEFKDYLLKSIRLYAYQRNNFKNTDNKEINNDYDTTSFSTTENNIFMKDFYVCLGMPTEDFDSDIAEILTPSKKTYKKWYNKEGEGEASIDVANRKEDNTKYLNLRWIHKDAKKDIIATVEENELPGDYEIRWYRYSLGAESPDIFAGAHWARFYGCNDDPDSNGDYCITKENIEDKESGIEDIATNKINITFYPNVNKASEQLKVIILKREKTFEGFLDQTSDKNEPLRVVAVSPIIEFTNEDDVRSQATVIDENALSIKFNDDEKGNYFLYDRAGNISKEEDKELRILTAVFDTSQDNVYAKPLLKQPYNSIKWIFPASGSMIIPMTSGDPLDAEDIVYKEGFSTINKTGYKIDYNDTDDTFEFTLKEREAGDSQDYLISVGYRLMPALNRNANRNIVRLEINKDGQLFTAQVQMNFGTAGTSGSDYTLVVIWDNNQNALEVYKDNNDKLKTKTLSGAVYLYDQAGNIVDIDEGQYKYELTPIKEGEKIFEESIKEEKDLYYPVTPCTFSETTFPDAVPYNNKATHFNKIDDTYIDLLKMPQYYLSSYWREQDINDYAFYNVNTKSFEKVSNDNYNSDYSIIYSKPKAKEMKKIKFQAFDYIKIDDNKAGTIEIDDNNKTTYYYDSIKRMFVKYNDTYIVDPWDSYQEDETYYYPVYDDDKDYLSSVLKIISTKNNFTIQQENNTTMSMDNLYILKVTLTNFSDYDLVASFPIPLKYSSVNTENKLFTIDYIEGPTEVRYDTSGEVDFKKNPYQITLKLLDENKLNYEILRQGYEDIPENIFGRWELIYQNSNNSNNNFLPTLNESKTFEILNLEYFVSPLLSPPSVYFKDTPLYGIKFITNKNIYDLNDNSKIIIPAETTLWTQPIYVYQDNYPSTTLNKWNGKDIITDEETGIISTKGFSAGRKERNNTFTGVVIGDWSKTDTDKMITAQTGVYGFNQGALSYALKDDGKAFFGKDGKGRIYLDGDKAQIYSSEWKAFKDSSNSKQGIYTQYHYGMMIDIDDGILDVRSKRVNNDTTSKEYNRTLIEPGNLEISIGNDRTFDNSDKKILMKVSKDDYYLQSADFNSTSGNEKGVKFDLKNNKLTGYNFKLEAGSGNNKLIINSDSTTNGTTDRNGETVTRYLYKPLKIGNNKFYVEWDGYLFSNYGTIGNWHITNNVLSSSATNPLGQNAVYLNAHPESGQPNIYGAFIKGGSLEIGTNSSVKFWRAWESGDGSTIYTRTSLPAFRVNSNGTLRIGGDTRDASDNEFGAFFEVNNLGQIFIRNKYGDKVFHADDNGNLTLSGTIKANAGNIGGWFIKDNRLANSDSSVYLGPTGFRLTSNFSVNSSGYLSATGATISGDLTATTLTAIKGGMIGNWSISKNNLSGGTLSAGTIEGSELNLGTLINGYYPLTVTSKGVLRIGGNTGAGSTNSNFRVTEYGNVYINGNVTIGKSESSSWTKVYIDKDDGRIEAKNIYSSNISSPDIYGSTTIYTPLGGGYVSLGGLAAGLLASNPENGKYPSSYLLDTNVIPWSAGIGLNLESSGNVLKIIPSGLKMYTLDPGVTGYNYGYFRLRKYTINSTTFFAFENYSNTWSQ